MGSLAVLLLVLLTQYFSFPAVLQPQLDELPLALAGGYGRNRQLKQAVIHSTAFLKHFRAEIHLCSPVNSVTGKETDRHVFQCGNV